MTKDEIRISAMLAEIEAHKITVKAMEVANQEREQNGQAQAYCSSDFMNEAYEISAIAKIMRVMA